MLGLKTALCGAEVYLIESNPWVVEWGRGSEEGEGVILSDHAIQDLSGPHRETQPASMWMFSLVCQILPAHILKIFSKLKKIFQITYIIDHFLVPKPSTTQSSRYHSDLHT